MKQVHYNIDDINNKCPEAQYYLIYRRKSQW